MSGSVGNVTYYVIDCSCAWPAAPCT